LADGHQLTITASNVASENNNPDRSFWVQFARYSQLAFVLPACTVAGWLIGAGLDKWLHMTWLYLLGLILGIAAGFVELVRTVTSSESREGQ
jgi:F0F1-type ATP synthase assembly protein I